MAQNFSVYQDPGIYIQDITSPSVTTQVSLQPVVVCLVGQAVGYQSWTDVMNNPTQGGTGRSLSLTQLGIATSSVVVSSTFGATIYTAGTDYVVTSTPSSDTFPLDTTTTVEILPTVANGGTGTIPAGTLLNIAYNYTNQQYFKPYVFQNFNSVTKLYGNPFTSSGVIQSPLSLAAQLAFQNGANTIITLAVQPANGMNPPTETDWDNSLQLLLNEPEIDVIVPITGDTNIHQFVVNIVNQQYTQGIYQRTFVGQDGTVNPSSKITPTAIEAQAASYNSVRVSVFAPPIVQFDTGRIVGVINLGAQYVAAAAAGLLSAQAGPWIPITWKNLKGFSSILNQEQVSTIITEQSSGVTVAYMQRSGNIIIKHGLTTNMTDYVSQEISVQITLDKLFDLILATIQAQGLIGSPFTQTTANAAIGAVQAALQQAQSAGMIYSYTGLQYAVPNPTPTSILINFSYQPTLPLNYIDVQMAIDSTAGTTQFSATPLTTSNSSTG